MCHIREKMTLKKNPEGGKEQALLRPEGRAFQRGGKDAKSLKSWCI